MKLFLDTNVLLDHALARPTGQPYEAKFLLSWGLENEIPMYMSSGSLYGFTYLLQKGGLRGEDLRQRLRLYLQFIKVSHMDTAGFQEALLADFKDIEDSYQHSTAVLEQCDYLITNNVNDYSNARSAELKVMTTRDFLIKVLKRKKGVDF